MAATVAPCSNRAAAAHCAGMNTRPVNRQPHPLPVSFAPAGLTVTRTPGESRLRNIEKLGVHHWWPRLRMVYGRDAIRLGGRVSAPKVL